jgi:hypothetical protein
MTDKTAHLTAALEREGVRLEKRPVDMRCCRCRFDQSWKEDFRVLISDHLVCADCEADLNEGSTR